MDTRFLDRRLNVFRADRADIALKGLIEAARFVDGVPARVVAPVVPLRPVPDAARGIDTQLILGEDVTVFDRAHGWAWVKSMRDGYVGYLQDDALAAETTEPTHHVVVPRSFIYPGPDLRFPAVATISMGSRIAVVGEAETRNTLYYLLADGTAVISAHCLPLGTYAGDDYVAIAARFLETPYLWGGRSGLGIDCSGLVQLCLEMTGRRALRDSDMQAAGLGHPIAREDLRRGDLVFWKGHVAIMEDERTMIHASGHTMTVTREDLDAAVERIARLYDRPNGYRRPF